MRIFVNNIAKEDRVKTILVPLMHAPQIQYCRILSIDFPIQITLPSDRLDWHIEVDRIQHIINM